MHRISLADGLCLLDRHNLGAFVSAADYASNICRPSIPPLAGSKFSPILFLSCFLALVLKGARFGRKQVRFSVHLAVVPPPLPCVANFHDLGCGKA